MIGWLRILWYGIQGFRRNVWLSAIAIITMTLTIATITIFVLGNVVATKKYQEFNSLIDYNIFLKDSASDADIDQLKTQVKARPEVQLMNYLTKDDARKRFEQANQNEDALKGIFNPDNNPLPREIDVKFKNPEQIDTFDTFIRDKRFEQLVEDTTYRRNKNLISNYLRFTNFLKVFGLSFTIFFLLIALLVILNTIRLTIYSRREEIEVMRLVGATRGYIRGPFLVEGVLFGLIGALISAVLAWAFLYQLQQLMSTSFGGNSFNQTITDLFSSILGGRQIGGSAFNILFLQLFALQLFCGLVLGVLCSFVAVRRYLRES